MVQRMGNYWSEDGAGLSGDEGQCVLDPVLRTHGNTYLCRNFGADVLPEI